MGLSPFDYLKLRTRIDQLVEDGYLIQGTHPNSVQITRKGISVLMACADRPQSVGRLSKPSLKAERANTDANHTSQKRNDPDNPEGKGYEDA